MTEKDLRLEYKKETGKRIPDQVIYPNIYIDEYNQDIILDYIHWLEEKVIQAQEISIKGKELISVINKL